MLVSYPVRALCNGPARALLHVASAAPLPASAVVLEPSLVSAYVLLTGTERLAGYPKGE